MTNIAQKKRHPIFLVTDIGRSPVTGDQWNQRILEQALIRHLDLEALNIVRANKVKSMLDEYETAKEMCCGKKNVTPFVVDAFGSYALSPHTLPTLHIQVVSDIGDLTNKFGSSGDIIIAPRYRLPEVKETQHIVPMDLFPSRVADPQKEPIPEEVQASILQARARAEQRCVPLVFAYVRTGDTTTLAQIHALSQRAELLLSTGPRTDDYFTRCIANKMDEEKLSLPASPFYFFHQDRHKPNPYIPWLLAADAVAVTDDSMSGVSDAVIAGKPVTLLTNKEKNECNNIFMRPLIQAGAVLEWSNADYAAHGFQPRSDTLTTFEQAITEVVRRIYAAAEETVPAIPVQQQETSPLQNAALG